MQAEEDKVLQRIRMREYRAKKRLNKTPKGAREEPVSHHGYSSRQSFGKATKKAASALPYSPIKKRSVVRALAMEVGLEVAEQTTKKTAPNTLDDDVKQSVLSFYESDDISWQAPGLKDRVIIRDGANNKQYKQARYMLLSLKEAHHAFQEACPEKKIGLSKFCSLRPEHIKLFDEIPHHVCVCTHHENIRLLLTSLAKNCKEIKTEFRIFIDQIVCDSSSKVCLLVNS